MLIPLSQSELTMPTCLLGSMYSYLLLQCPVPSQTVSVAYNSQLTTYAGRIRAATQDATRNA